MDRNGMPAKFKDLMQQVSSLTRVGRLQEATLAIQRALGDSAPTAFPANAAGPRARDDRVIDVDAAEIPAAPGVQEASPSSTEPSGTEAGQFLAGSFQHGGRSVQYKLFVPSGMPAAPRPLVLMLHGCTQDPDDFAAGTQMNRLAQEHGFLVLYPAQSQDANPQRCWNWFKSSHQQRGRGEPALLAALTREITKTHRTDADRVFVAGLSAGGAMAAVLAQTYPDVFAAAGVHSGLAPGTARDAMGALQAMHSGKGPDGGSRIDATTPAPTIVFHGDRDGTVHSDHGNHVVSAALSGRKPRTTEERGTSPHGVAYTRRTHRDEDGRTVAEQWIVHGAGHAWSGGSADGSFTEPRGPDASREMLRFFLAHGHRSSDPAPR
ncbi:MAG: PHB depolymerase family esterase [Xylophilus ampelinus]